jgi:hypothetical protein
MVLPLSLGAMSGIGLFLVISVPLHSAYSEHAGRICDQQVSILLSMRDLVELQRAEFLVRWFNCAIERRMP